MTVFPPRHIRRTVFVVSALLLVGLLILPQSSAKGREYSGRTVLEGADRTDAGDFPGTWFYVSKLRKMALWFRQSGEEIQVKFRIQEIGSDSFTTDWAGHADYTFRGMPGSFKMSFDENNDKTVSGTWEWRVGDETTGRRQTAKFEIYRFGIGRDLLVRLTDVHTDIFGPMMGKLELDEQLWTFRKTSRREALWGEMPF